MGLFSRNKSDTPDNPEAAAQALAAIVDESLDAALSLQAETADVVERAPKEEAAPESAAEDEGAGMPDADEDVAPFGPVDENGRLRTYADKLPVTRVVGQTKIVAIINQKGGVGKSTTAINLSAALGEMGRQVLLVDLDPQGNTTSGLGIDKRLITRSIYDVLMTEFRPERVYLQDVIIPDVYRGLDVVPATLSLAGAELELAMELARESRLKDALGSFRGKYDYIFIDCPPSLGLLTVNALVAAEKILTPIQCEFYALEGVTKLLETMTRVKSALNPTLDMLGILMTMYQRTKLSTQVVEEVRKHFGAKVFDTVIPRAVKISEAPSYGMPITQYDPSGKGAKAYRALAKEVIQRG